MRAVPVTVESGWYRGQNALFRPGYGKKSYPGFLFTTRKGKSGLGKKDKEQGGIFSSVGISERPDTVCGKVSEGRVAILVDGTPNVLIVPYLFVENFQSFDDYVNRPFYAAFTRWVKYLSFFIAIFLPGIFEIGRAHV